MNPPSEHEPGERAASPGQDALLLQLAREKAAISVRLTAVMLALYLGYVLALAFAPQVLEGRIGSATMGIPLGIGLIVLAWLLTGVYVRWANSRHDDLVRQILSRSRES